MNEERPIKAPTARGAAALVRRVQRLGQRIGALAERKRLALERLNLVGAPIAVDGVEYEVFEPAGRFVFNAKLDLRKITKTPRAKAKAAAVAAGVSSANEEGGAS